MKYILLISFCFGINYSYSQERNFEVLGRELALAIMNKDTASFYSLILPKEAVIEKFEIEAEGKLKREEIEFTIKNIDENYTDLMRLTLGLRFCSLTTKTDIFKLDLLGIKYNVVETEETVIDSTIMAIHGEIDHHMFTHFTFYAAEYKEKLYLTSDLIDISEVDKFEVRARLNDVKLSADDQGNLIAQGKIELENKNAAKRDIFNCILNSPMTIGLKENSISSDNSKDFEIIEGQWKYTYYVNNSSDYAGIVEFKYEFKISDGIIDYKYYDFIHAKGDSEFESLGILPFEINETILGVFDEKQYQEIIGDIYLNQVLAIKRTKEMTDKCFK